MDKSQEIYVKKHHKLLKTKDKEKLLKAVREKWYTTFGEKQLKRQWISHYKPVQHFSNV